MIERLILALRLLASPPAAQLAQFSESKRTSEIALDFDDALRLVSDCPQIRLESRQRESLERLSDYLDARSDAGHASLWTESAIRDSADWQRIRELARAALESLDAHADGPT